MANISDDLSKYWRESCAEFESMTLKKKPVETIKKCWLRSNKTLAVTLAEFDAAHKQARADKTAFDNGKCNRKTLDSDLEKLTKKTESVKKMAKSQLAEVEEDIGAEIIRAKKPNEDEKTVYQRGLKYLKTTIDVIVKSAESVLQDITYSVNHAGQIMNDYVRAAELFEKQMIANIAKGRAATAKLKTAAAAAKTPEDLAKVIATYNASIIQNAGRDVNVITVGILQYCKRTPAVARFLDPIQAFYNFTKPWNEPNTHKLPATATKEDVITKIKEFNEMLKKAEIFAPRVMKDL